VLSSLLAEGSRGNIAPEQQQFEPRSARSLRMVAAGKNFQQE